MTLHDRISALLVRKQNELETFPSNGHWARTEEIDRLAKYIERDIEELRAVLDSPYLAALERLADATLRRAELETEALAEWPSASVSQKAEREASRTAQYVAIVELRELRARV